MYLSSISSSSPFMPWPSALQHSASSKGLSWVVSVRLQSVRRIFLITPCMKCPCPYSASAMIGHAHSVERLYPSWGASMSSRVHIFVRRLHPKFGFGYDWGRRFCELRGCFHWQIAVLLAVNLARLFNAPSARSNVSTDCTSRIQILYVEVVCSFFIGNAQNINFSTRCI